MAILVVGASNSIGKKIVKSLLTQDCEVIALVTDVENQQNLLEDRVKIFNADLTIPETLEKDILKELSTIIYCSETKETDNLEQKEFPKIQNLVRAVSQKIQPTTTKKLIFDFTNPKIDLKETWGTINDGVMGGVSQSNIRLADRKAIFSGIVSTDNNGGFASVRTKNFAPPLDLSNFEGIEIKVKGDGKRYKFITRCEGEWDGIGYCHSFDTVHDFSTTIQIPFADLIPVFRAKTVADADKLNSSKIYSMQLMLSKFEYDGALNPKFEAGHFAIEVDYIKAYSTQSKSQFILISSANASDLYRLNKKLQKSVLESSNLAYTVINTATMTSGFTEKLLDNL